MASLLQPLQKLAPFPLSSSSPSPLISPGSRSTSPPSRFSFSRPCLSWRARGSLDSHVWLCFSDLPQFSVRAAIPWRTFYFEFEVNNLTFVCNCCRLPFFCFNFLSRGSCLLLVPFVRVNSLGCLLGNGSFSVQFCAACILSLCLKG